MSSLTATPWNTRCFF